MRKFTDEEIQLCKEMAKKERKRIDDGDWYVRHDYDEPDVYLEGVDDDKEVAISIPLWQEHDCLEFLRKKGYRVKTDEDTYIEDDPFNANCYGHKANKAFNRYGKTPLEALLRAVLEALNADKMD